MSGVGGIGWSMRNGFNESWGSGVVGNGCSSIMSNWSNGLYNGGSNYSLNKRFTVDNSVETIDGVSSIVNSALVTVSVYQRVFTTYNVTVTFFNLTLGITRNVVLHIVAIFILRMRIVFINSFS